MGDCTFFPANMWHFFNLFFLVMFFLKVVERKESMLLDLLFLPLVYLGVASKTFFAAFAAIQLPMF